MVSVVTPVVSSVAAIFHASLVLPPVLCLSLCVSTWPLLPTNQHQRKHLTCVIVPSTSSWKGLVSPEPSTKLPCHPHTLLAVTHFVLSTCLLTITGNIASSCFFPPAPSLSSLHHYLCSRPLAYPASPLFFPKNVYPLMNKYFETVAASLCTSSDI